MEVSEIVEKVKSTPRYVRWVAISLIGLLVSFGVNRTVVLSYQGELEAKERQIRILEKKLNDLKRIKKRYDVVLMELNRKKRVLEERIRSLESKERTVEALKAAYLSSPVEVLKFTKTKKRPVVLKDREIPDVRWEVKSYEVVARGSYDAVKKWVKSVEGAASAIDGLTLVREDGLKGTVVADVLFSYKGLKGVHRLKRILRLGGFEGGKR